MSKKLSPMMQQYLLKKDEYPDCILFYRLGDFYEMFFDDAMIVSRALGLTLTARDCGSNKKAPMCGIPYHASNNYLTKLVGLGYKVAICEQLTEPTKGCTLVQRDVVRVVTPGTIIEAELLDDSKNNFIACIYSENDNYGIAYVDITTGEMYAIEGNSDKKDDRINDLLIRIKPSEVICNKDVLNYYSELTCYAMGVVPKAAEYNEWEFAYSKAEKKVCKQLNVITLDKFDLGKCKFAVIASGALLSYLEETQKRSMMNITRIEVEKDKNIMKIDINTRRNLELVESMKDKKTKGSLYWVLNSTKTSMGARMLRQWVEQPLQSEKMINERLDAIEELMQNTIVRETIAQTLREISDIERICGRVSYGTITPKGCNELKLSIAKIPQIKSAIKDLKTPLFKKYYKEIFDFDDIIDVLDRAFDENSPNNTQETGFIKAGFSTELDELKEKATGGRAAIAQMDAQERLKTNIKNLKIGYNSVFGYFIEVPKSQIQFAPKERYQRKQTLANCERYVTDELKKLEEEILSAEESLLTEEQKVFKGIRQQLINEIPAFLGTARVLAMIDSLLSLALVALENNFTKPIINSSVKETNIIDGKHCVVEQMLKGDRFVPNDTLLDNNENRVLVITGPNMAGKSTYMRQVALIVLMAHIGSFVPAQYATIALTDRIFTRIGASDDLAFGQSTFMVEMLEVSNILSNVTDNSLVILDEVGRGTSTYDGLSIAWAVVEHLSKKTKAKVLFATHYHELTELEGTLEGVKNYQISVKEFDNSVIFLRKIVRGGANRSFGIEVASMSGLPDSVIARAREILRDLQNNDITHKHLQGAGDAVQETKPDEELVKLANYIKKINVDAITPLEALTAINTMKEIINVREDTNG